MTQRSFLPEPPALEHHKAKLRRKAERRRLLAKPCDFGLFGAEHLQTDLVDELRKTAGNRNSETFTLIGRPTLVFRVVRRYSIGTGRHAIACVIGHSDDGRRTTARVEDVVFLETAKLTKEKGRG